VEKSSPSWHPKGSALANTPEMKNYLFSPTKKRIREKRKAVASHPKRSALANTPKHNCIKNITFDGALLKNTKSGTSKGSAAATNTPYEKIIKNNQRQ